jgi:hypothetical protein
MTKTNEHMTFGHPDQNTRQSLESARDFEDKKIRNDRKDENKRQIH